MSFEFYRDLYESEWNRRDEICQATALPAGVLTLTADCGDKARGAAEH